MDRMQEERFYRPAAIQQWQPSQAQRHLRKSFWRMWSTVGQIIERRQIIIPNDGEKTRTVSYLLVQ
jgi:hypothetical protein